MTVISEAVVAKEETMTVATATVGAVLGVPTRNGRTASRRGTVRVRAAVFAPSAGRRTSSVRVAAARRDTTAGIVTEIVRVGAATSVSAATRTER